MLKGKQLFSTILILNLSQKRWTSDVSNILNYNLHDRNINAVLNKPFRAYTYPYLYVPTIMGNTLRVISRVGDNGERVVHIR